MTQGLDWLDSDFNKKGDCKSSLSSLSSLSFFLLTSFLHAFARS
jgi:hypothetical protein